MAVIPVSVLEFLEALKENNTREWFATHKPDYQEQEQYLKEFYKEVEAGLNEHDIIEKTKIFRIHKDVRFSKDKTPYNTHRSVSFSRSGAHLRGGYYLRIAPGSSVVAGGFFAPQPSDLLRIRKEFEMDDTEIRDILNQRDFKKIYGGFDTSNQVKTAPKGFSKEHAAIDLIRNKNFVVRHELTDKEVLHPDFAQQVLSYFGLLRPLFDYMSDVLTTDLNGVSLLDQ